MLNVQLDETNGIVTLVPEGQLEKDDFKIAATQIDPLIEKLGKLNGLLIHVEKFPGWDSFGGLIAHLKFVRDHQKEIRRVALATDSAIGHIGETIGRHFMKAEVRHFDFQALEEAKGWLKEA